MTKCPYCLNGWRRDIVTGTDEDGNEETHDIECTACDGTGFILDYKEQDGGFL